MDAQTLVNETNRKLSGEYEVIEFDSDDWNTIVSALNENIDLYNKSDSWRTSYDPEYVLGTVSTSQFYTINWDNITSISGSNRQYIRFYNDSTLVDKYKLVKQDIFDESGNNAKVATINMNGLQIKPKVSTDTIYGADIVLPVFRSINKITRKTDVVRIDDIYWLIAKTAADLSSTSPVDFIARNFDSFKEDAKDRMKAMKKENRITQTSYPVIGNWSPSGRPDGR